MIAIKGNAVSKIDRESKEYKSLQAFHERLKSKDSTIWGAEAQAEASIRMNWIDLPESSRDLLPQFDALAAKHRDKTSVILCGMGGSSLGPEVIAQTFSKKLLLTHWLLIYLRALWLLAQNLDPPSKLHHSAHSLKAHLRMRG
jgi:glucose-6-phosphate isomerase